MKESKHVRVWQMLGHKLYLQIGLSVMFFHNFNLCTKRKNPIPARKEETTQKKYIYLPKVVEKLCT